MKKRNWIISALLLAVLVLLTTIYITSPNDFDKGKSAFEVGDFKQAVHYYRLAAEQGNASAQFNLGLMYVNGQGVVKNDTQAFEYFSRAAAQGYARGQNGLGVMYDKGLGVAQNDRQAFKYHHLAAEQGYAAAQHNLGAMYRNGRGVPKNEQIAYQWYLLAAAQGEESAKEGMALLENTLTPKQRRAAQGAATKWQEAFDAK